jgi:hypothetical protein
MKKYTLVTASALLALNVGAPLHAAAVDKSTPSNAEAPVAQPETDPSLSNSGKLVPGQPIRPEADEEASVPKTPMDKAAANSADVGAKKTDMKANRAGSATDTGNVPKEPKPKP